MTLRNLTLIKRSYYAYPVGVFLLDFHLRALERARLIDIVLDDDRVSFETRGFLDESENANGQRKLGRYIKRGSAGE